MAAVDCQGLFKLLTHCLLLLAFAAFQATKDSTGQVSFVLGAQPGSYTGCTDRAAGLLFVHMCCASVLLQTWDDAKQQAYKTWKQSKGAAEQVRLDCW
jgi:hypothetical protein